MSIRKNRFLLVALIVGGLSVFCTVTFPPATPVPPTITPPSDDAFYVSLAGDDANDGTKSHPWRTLQKAADTLVAGGMVFVEAGHYAERVILSRSGSSTTPIHFEAVGQVIMQGFTITADHVIIRGFEITDTPDDAQNGWGIWVRGSDCILDNNHVHDATRGGIILFVMPGEEEKTHDCEVTNNRLYRNAFAGLEVHGRSHLVAGNEIWGTIQIHPKWSNPPNWADADGIRFHGVGHVFRKNYIHAILYGIPENPTPHIDCFQTFADGSYHEAASHIVFEQNLCENMQAQSPLEAGKAFMIEDASGLIIRNNILRAFRVIQAIDSSNLQIVNNTMTNRLDLPVEYSPVMITATNTQGLLIQNNIFFEPVLHVFYFSDDSAGIEPNIGYNNTYRSDGMNVYGEPYPHDLWNINPGFVDAASGNFHLSPDSPLIDAGTNLTMVASDYDGDARPQGGQFDIGMDEWMYDNSFNIDNLIGGYASLLSIQAPGR